MLLYTCLTVIFSVMAGLFAFILGAGHFGIKVSMLIAAGIAVAAAIKSIFTPHRKPESEFKGCECCTAWDQEREQKP